MERYFKLHEDEQRAINKDLPAWVETFDRYKEVESSIRQRLDWNA